jgi:hypothetical protein
VVEFRPLITYQGEFGFDWLRVYEGPDSGATINHTEEIPYIDAADATATRHTGQVEGGFNSAAPNGPGLTPAEAKTRIQTEYNNFPIVRSPSAPVPRINYRLLTYFVPYLNLFPDGTEPAWVWRTPTVGAYILKPPSGVTLPKPPCEAKLQVLIDIKHQAPDKIVLEYNPEFLEITGAATSGATTPGKYVIPGGYTVTPETYADNVKKSAEITVKCINATALDIEILAWAYDCNGVKVISNPVGKMIVRANTIAHQRVMKIALASVKTNTNNNSRGGNIGTFNPPTANLELTQLFNTLHQALIIPDVVNTIVAPSGSQDVTLDLTQNRRFHHDPTAAGSAITGSLTTAGGLTTGAGGTVGQFVHPPATTSATAVPCIDVSSSNYDVYLEQLLNDKYPELRPTSYWIVFNFGEAGWVTGLGPTSVLNGIASGRDV